MATAAKAGKKKAPVVSPAIKPGSYEEYLWNHPEEMERLLREYGIDPDDDSTLGDWDIARAKNRNNKSKA
jgi:hypothetical protein